MAALTRRGRHLRAAVLGARRLHLRRSSTSTASLHVPMGRDPAPAGTPRYQQLSTLLARDPRRHARRGRSCCRPSRSQRAIRRVASYVARGGTPGQVSRPVARHQASASRVLERRRMAALRGVCGFAGEPMHTQQTRLRVLGSRERAADASWRRPGTDGGYWLDRRLPPCRRRRAAPSPPLVHVGDSRARHARAAGRPGAATLSVRSGREGWRRTHRRGAAGWWARWPCRRPDSACAGRARASEAVRAALLPGARRAAAVGVAQRLSGRSFELAFTRWQLQTGGTPPMTQPCLMLAAMLAVQVGHAGAVEHRCWHRLWRRVWPGARSAWPVRGAGLPDGDGSSAQRRWWRAGAHCRCAAPALLAVAAGAALVLWRLRGRYGGSRVGCCWSPALIGLHGLFQPAAAAVLRSPMLPTARGLYSPDQADWRAAGVAVAGLSCCRIGLAWLDWEVRHRVRQTRYLAWSWAPLPGGF